MKNDPLGAGKRDPLSKTIPDKNRSKEFEIKQEQEAKQMLEQSGDKKKDFQQPSPSDHKSTIITTLNEPQQNSSRSSLGQAFNYMTEAPRKLLFPNFTAQQPQPVIDQDFVVVQQQVLDIRAYELDQVLAGEVLKYRAAVHLTINANYVCPGVLYITNYQFIFVPDKDQKLSLERRDSYSLPLACISKVERIPEKKSDYSVVEIHSKDGRAFKFRELTEQSNQISQLLCKLAFNDARDKFFAFAHHKDNKDLEERRQGWKIYQIEADFKRQGVRIASNGEQEKCLFKYMNNQNGGICATYPERLVVPFSAENESILRTAKFRTKERLPILVYAQPYQDRVVQMWRSSQCKTGLGNNRSQEDEAYLDLIAQQSLTFDPECALKIFDARPYLNAVSQQVAGKGYENTQFYKRCTIDFLGIHNIHKVRDSYKKLKSICYDQNLTVSALEASGWYDHILSIIQGAEKVASAFSRKKVNVLVHCSDGWDRTSQLVSLVQVMIDPYYRTIEGFMVLVHKDWVIAGHQFYTRAGTGNKHHNDESRAPIFVQFLDCVYQLIHTYPLSFEINHRILAELAIHYQSGLYGTFLGDSNLELQRFSIPTTTVSVFSKFLDQRERYINPYYKQTELGNNTIIPSNFNACNIRFWKEHFAYHVAGSSDTYNIYPDLDFTDENQMEMHKNINYLNHILRQSQIDQEQMIKVQQQRIEDLTRLIESQPGLASQLEQLQQTTVWK